MSKDLSSMSASAQAASADQEAAAEGVERLVRLLRVERLEEDLYRGTLNGKNSIVGFALGFLRSTRALPLGLGRIGRP
jgi:hypothetical protein